MRDRRSGDTEMKKIYIEYMPAGYKIAVAAVFAVYCIMQIMTAYATTETGNTITAVLLILLAVMMLTGLLANTAIEFGEGSVIKCSWLFIRKNIDIEKMRGASYSLKWRKEKVGGNYYIELMLYGDDKPEPYKINDRLSPDDAESCIKGDYDKTQLMEVYRYIEQYDSRKAFGFEKD